MSEQDKQHFAKYQAHFSGVLRDGHTMFIDDVVTDLNRKSFLESEVIELRRENAELEKDMAYYRCCSLSGEVADDLCKPSSIALQAKALEESK